MYNCLWEDIENLCKEETSLYGVANITAVKEYLKIYSPFVLEFTHAISIGLNLPNEIIDNINDKKGELDYLDTYIKVNSKLDEIGLKIENIIKKDGFDAKLIPASNIISKEKLIGDISHKLIANISGLGWIGKSCLLITPEYGPRIRWATILTNAPLPSNNEEMENKCGNCTFCVDNCPVNAFSGAEFNKNDLREVRYDAFKCYKYFDDLEKQGHPRLCGICVKICPWGLSKKKV